MSCIDRELYNYDNLNSEDKTLIDTVEYVRKYALSQDIIDDYLEEHYNNSVMLQKILREILENFMSKIHNKVDKCSDDMIVCFIDDYTDEEWEQIQKEKKGIQC